VSVPWKKLQYCPRHALHNLARHQYELRVTERISEKSEMAAATVLRGRVSIATLNHEAKTYAPHGQREQAGWP